MHNRGSNKISSRIAQIRLVSSHPEVYEPCDDSFALVDALLADRNNLLEHRPTLCMEVGCGSGYVITSLALMLGEEVPGVQYIATDTNSHAVEVTRETLKAHGVHAELINTDIASGLEKRLAGLIDVMVVNPPYVPTPEDEVGREGIASAWAGGENGRCKGKCDSEQNSSCKGPGHAAFTSSLAFLKKKWQQQQQLMHVQRSFWVPPLLSVISERRISLSEDLTRSFTDKPNVTQLQNSGTIKH
ncbi:hypothetical protein LWI29_017976 [Acer saccharum]|uniref:Methyltransferase small domain-containing protein n=1 Tax=Acer saccharum TaxID=4024 RepID=A0AA39RS77_ACESA|nr:hypothetical protein LWI29_017976 [Acer saccharum]